MSRQQQQLKQIIAIRGLEVATSESDYIMWEFAAMVYRVMYSDHYPTMYVTEL